jgi:hypothetical protein
MQRFDRRSFIRVGSLGLFGSLGYGDMLRLMAQSPPAEPVKRPMAVIHLFLAGAMSQVESFDPKPDADSKYRSIFKPIATNVDGIQICEHLPMLAKMADKYTIIRSMTHKIADHDQATTLIMTAREPLPTIQVPWLPAVVNKELTSGNELPAAIAIPGAPINSAGFLGPRYNPFNAGNPNADQYKVRDMELPMGVEWARMERRQKLLNLVDENFRRIDRSGVAESMDAYYHTALDLMKSEKAKQAFKIEEETDKVRERYGRTSFGQSTLLARRLVEAGVRFLTVGLAGWDHHQNIFPEMKNTYLPDLDRSVSALLEDLDQRGMLDSTLVVMNSEFGRTPEINGSAGRDHWPNAFSAIVAGGGVRGGRVWGATDEKGGFVKDNPVQIPDFVATIYKKLGIDPQKEYISNIGRPIKLGANGRPLEFLL